MSEYSTLDAPEALNVIFHPRSEARTPCADNARDFDIKVADDAVLGCRFHEAGKDAATILYFHGNGETTGDYDDIAHYYVKHGINIFIATYRGYGWSTGTPSVSDMFRDADAVFQELRTWLDENNFTEPLFIMGRSLGSASALDLASRNQDLVKGIFIESGFADTLPLMKNLGFDMEAFGFTEENGFRNREKIGKITKPTMILHGARDEIIPVASAERLQADSGARSKQFLVIPGADHNSLIAMGGEKYFETIKTFIDTTCGKNTWRDKRKKYRREHPRK